MESKYAKYNFTVNTFSASGNIPRENKCNGFTATNIGDTIVRVNGKVLFPSLTPATVSGDSVSFGGNAGEIYIGYITIAFQVAVGAAPLVEIMQKFFNDPEDNK